MSKADEFVDRFVERLERLRADKDRGALARLRRGLGKPPGFAPERDNWVLQQHVPPSREDACCLIASLFALHSEAGGEGSFGTAFARLKAATGGDGAERRFVVLLDSDVEDLPGRLRHAVSLLKSKNIPVDWRQLLRDVYFWDHPQRFVQRRWARDFWAGVTPKEPSEVAESNQETTL